MSPRPSTSASPKRRVLHERTPSQTNEGSPNRSPKEKERIDIYSANPYPTKPNQVFLPRPGIGQPYALHGAYGVSDVSLASAQTDHTATGPSDEHHHLDAGLNAPWEFSSSVDLGHSSSQVWDDDPQSSQSSFPTPLLPSDDLDEHDVAYHDDKSIPNFQHLDLELQHQSHSGSDPVDTRGSEEEDDEAADDDDVITLPPPLRATVKTVSPEHSSPRTDRAGDLPTSDNYVTYGHSSSPNVVPIGAPSSPNFVAYDSSSPNLIAYGSSSPQIMAHAASDSTDSSSNSLGTVVHTHTANPGWPGVTPEPNSSQPASFTSSPPEQLLREYQSASSLALSAGTQLSRTRTASSGSGPSEGSSQFGPENTAAIQYPRIREPSSSSSYAESFNPTSQTRRTVRTVSDRSTGRWNPTLSTVPSDTPTSTNNQPNSGNSQGLGLIPAKKSKLSIGSVDDNTEHLDRLSNLPRSTLRHIPSSLMGSTESRPGSSSSGNVIMNMLPNWVRLYYHGNNQYPQNPAQSILDPSRPQTAASRPASPVRYPENLSLPRIRPKSKRAQPTRLLTDHPADPRSHWKRGQGEKDASSEISAPQPVAKAWSPHLHPNKGQPSPRNTWIAPSLDSRNEPALGRRNVQVYSFCLGFLFPLAWVIAAFLPLPPQPSSNDEEMVAGAGAKYRIQQYEKRRYQSARWWRNVNRVMIPVGTAIIAIIVSEQYSNFHMLFC